MIKGWEAPGLAPGMFKGNWEEAWGLRGEEVLQALTDMATAMKKSVAQLLVTSLDTVTPPVKESLAAPSRRRFNGWFLEIGITRRAIHKLNRMEGALRQGCKDKVRRLWKGLSEGQRTAMYPAVAPPVTDNAGQWRW